MIREPHVSIEGALYDVKAGVMTIPDARDAILEYCKKHLIDTTGPLVRDITAVPLVKPKSLVRDIVNRWIDSSL